MFANFLSIAKLLTNILVIISTQSILSQIKPIVVDSLTQEPIPYVNIWVLNENISTATNTTGHFSIQTLHRNKILVLSATGYHTKKYTIQTAKDSIFLAPYIVALDEAVVKATAKARKKTRTINKIQRSKLGAYLPGFKDAGRVYAQYITYDSTYNQTPFIKEIRIATESKLDTAKLILRLFAKNNQGRPDGYIYSKNIIVAIRNGKKTTRVDLASLALPMPKEGFFVGVEWIYEEKNRSYFNSYYPEVGFMQLETDENSWYYNYGKWKKIWKNTGKIKSYRNKYNHLALEVVLTNESGLR